MEKCNFIIKSWIFKKYINNISGILSIYSITISEVLMYIRYYRNKQTNNPEQQKLSSKSSKVNTEEKQIDYHNIVF